MSGPSPWRRAVFLDRDGVLNALVARDGSWVSPRCAADFRLIPGVDKAIQRLRDSGYAIFVASNQPDVARGKLPVRELEAMTLRLRAALPIDDVAYCLHDDADDCGCRKPRAGMLTDLAARWGVDLSRSVMVGDSWKDVEAGRTAGCRTVYVGPAGGWRSPPDLTAASLGDAVAGIVAFA